MGIAAYEIVRKDSGWSVAHEGRTAGSYATKEANAIKQGHEVRVSVPGVQGSEPTLGTS
jgi:hypothetical protein